MIPRTPVFSALAAAFITASGAAAADPATYLALGDSYTIGEGVDEAQRWPVQLAAALTAAGTPCAPPHIIARTGWTTDEMLHAVQGEYRALVSHNGPLPVYDLVTLLIGVNDQYRGRSPDDFSAAFPVCLASAVELAGGRRDHVVVVAIPDYGCTPFGKQSGMQSGAQIHAGIDAFDRILKTDAVAPFGYADILAVSRTVPEHADWVGPDGLHPTGAQYAAWTSVILPVAKAALTGAMKTGAATAAAATP